MTADLPDEVTQHPLRKESEWLAKRDSGIEPLYQSDLVTDQRTRDEFLCGAWLLNDMPANGKLLDQIHPQMLRVADMLAAGRLMNAVIMPRRSSKTTTLFCILLGRCYLRPVHMAGFTLLTTQKKTSERYRLDIYGPIARRWPEEENRPVKLIRSNGSERVEFPNGSVLSVLSPDGDAIRSGAYDTLLADEAGEATPERWEDVIGAVIPSFDTRPEGQLVLAGTAGDYRAGSEFWATLNDERAGRVAYMLPDDIDPEELTRWDPDEEHPDAHARELTLRMHPGIGTLTTLDRIQNSYERLGVKKYTREYFNIFGSEGSNTALLSAPKWSASGLATPTAGLVPPEVFALSAFVHPDAAWASIAAAWKGADGNTHVGLLHHQEGVAGFALKLMTLARKFNRPITYDAGSNATEVEMRQLREARPAPLQRPLLTRDISRAAVHFTNLLNQDQLRHYDQQEMNAAAEIAVKRAFGQSGGWAFGRPDVKNRPSDDITPLEAASLAVYVLDQERANGGVPVIDFF